MQMLDADPWIVVKDDHGRSVIVECVAGDVAGGGGG
jgi:hypothetical protein